MQNLAHLPEKFSFKLDETAKKWIKETFGIAAYDNQGGFFNYPNYKNSKGFKKNWHLSFTRQMNGYTLITTDKLFPPQNNVPTIEKGVMMLVWAFEEELATEKEVIFCDGKYYYAKHQKKNEPLVSWQNAKPILSLPEYTIEEAQKKFKFKVKCTSTE
jgi:hypothetical protein